jgi:uncharacterized membrane protein YgcG
VTSLGALATPWRTAVRLLTPLAVAALVLVPGAGVAAAADGERVASFDARIDVDAHGDLHITETIDYVFAGTAHHGLQREVRTRSRRPGDDRTRPVLQVSASSPSGAPAQVTVIADRTLTTIRVGDPRQTVSGRQTYILRYTVDGAVDRVDASTRPGGGAPLVPPHDELYWNVTGTEWDVPIERASVQVTAPQPALAARCYEGPEASTRPCTGTAGPTAVFAAQNLGPGEGLTAVVAYPVGTVAAPRPASGAPEQAEPSTLGEIVGFVLVLGLVTGLVIFGQWFARSAETGSSTGAARAPSSRHTAPDAFRSPVGIDLAGLPRPPAGLRPGHVAVLRDGRAATAAVTATLADLAVRGHLRIEELPAGGRPSSSWRLVAQEPRPGETLLPYEQTLLAALFTGRDSVTGKDLRGSRHLAAVRRQLLDDATGRGWFPRNQRRPDVHAPARGLTVGGFVIAFLAHVSGTIPVFLAGVAIAYVGRVIGSRPCDRPVRPTPLGDAARRQVNVFRDQLTAAAAERRSLDDADEVFSTLLPFAIALGLADDWIDGFRVDVRGPRWYAAATGAGPPDLGAAVSAFESASGFDTNPTVGSSGSGWWGHSHGSGSFGSSSGFDGSGSSGSSGHGGGGGGGSSW